MYALYLSSAITDSSGGITPLYGLFVVEVTRSQNLYFSLDFFTCFILLLTASLRQPNVGEIDWVRNTTIRFPWGPPPDQPPGKNITNNHTRGNRGATTNLQIVLNTPLLPYLNQATKESTCRIFEISESKISNPN